MAASPLAPWRVLNRAFETLGKNGLALVAGTAIIYVVPSTLMSDWAYDTLWNPETHGYLSPWENLGLSVFVYVVYFALHGLRFGVLGQILMDRWRGQPFPRGMASTILSGVAKVAPRLWLYLPVTAVTFFLFYWSWGIAALPIQVIGFSMFPMYILNELPLKEAWRFSLAALKGRLWLIVGNIIVINILTRIIQAVQRWAQSWILSTPSSRLLWEWTVIVPALVLVHAFLFAWSMSLFFTAREQTMGKVEQVEAVFE